MVRLGSGRWLPVSREGGPPPSSGSARVLALSLNIPIPSPSRVGGRAAGTPHHGLPALPGGPRLTLVHCLVGTGSQVPRGAEVGSDLAPAGLQWERQAGGSLPSGVLCPVHGTAVLPAWELGTSETPHLVEACPRESSPRRWPAGLAAKERGAGNGWSCGWGASRLRPAGPPLQQSRQRPWRPRELPPREAGRAGSRASLLPAPAPRGCPGCEHRAPCQRLMAGTSGKGRLGAEADRVDCGQRSVGGTRARVEWAAQAFQWGPWAGGGRALRGGSPRPRGPLGRLWRRPGPHGGCVSGSPEPSVAQGTSGGGGCLTWWGWVGPRTAPALPHEASNSLTLISEPTGWVTKTALPLPRGKREAVVWA